MTQIRQITETLHSSRVTEHLDDAEINSIATLFEVRHYPAGENMTPPERAEIDDLAILANGNIKVKVPCGVGESTICTLHPGDMVDFSGFASQTGQHASYYAVGNTDVLSMKKSQFDSLIHTHPKIMSRVVHGMLHSLQNIAKRMNCQFTELRNYIYQSNGRS